VKRTAANRAPPDESDGSSPKRVWKAARSMIRMSPRAVGAVSRPEPACSSRTPLKAVRKM